MSTHSNLIIEQEASEASADALRSVVQSARSSDIESLLLPTSICFSNGNLQITYPALQKEQQPLLQYISNGQASDREQIAQQIIINILKEIEIIHKSTFHGSIQPSSILVGLKGRIYFRDYGLAHIESYLKNKPPQVHPHLYPSERVLGGECNKESDIWAVGLCVVKMLLGEVPLENFSNETAMMLVCNHNVIQSDVLLKQFSELAQDFVSKCCGSAADRPSVTKLLSHQWLLKSFNTKLTPPPSVEQSNIRPISLNIILSALKESDLSSSRFDEISSEVIAIASQWDEFPEAFLDCILPHVTRKPADRAREILATNFKKTIRCQK